MPCVFPSYRQYKVLLFNDNGNTREYVSRSLVQVVGLSEATAFHIMQQVGGGATQTCCLLLAH